VKLLLDTQILLWSMSGDRKLNASARSLIANADENFVSSATIWEIAIKWKLGKIEFSPEIVAETLDAAGFEELQVTNRHAVATASLPLHHRDPFDRLLLAQAMVEGMRFLTSDARLAAYSALVITI
jgi:PIN domain nuclease of toxin-antitoxin system